jgi:hypothetical protein
LQARLSPPKELYQLFYILDGWNTQNESCTRRTKELQRLASVHILILYRIY